MSTALKPIDELRLSVGRMREEVKMAISKDIPAEKAERFFLTYLQQNQALMSCSRVTLFAAYMQACQAGLLIDGKECAIVAYGDKAQFMPMAAGIMKKARQGGVKMMDAQIVFGNDQYESYTDEKGPHFKHTKARVNPGDIVLTYAYAITEDDGFYFEEVTNEQMAAIEACSKGKSGPWKGPFRSEMMRKSAIKRLCKRLPSSTDLEEIIKEDNEEFGGVTEVVPEQPVSRLAQLVESHTAPKEQEAL